MEIEQLINGILSEHQKAEMAKWKATPDNRKKSRPDYFASHDQFGLEMELDLPAGDYLRNFTCQKDLIKFLRRKRGLFVKEIEEGRGTLILQ